MDVALSPVPVAGKPVIARLLEFYIYDFSEYMGWDVDRRGRFGYRYLDLYWKDDTRYPFLIEVDGAIAGFALVHVEDGYGEPRTSMAEFFVMRKFRRHGVGQAAAAMLFDRFPGTWEVRQIHPNVPAQRFWRSVIGAYTGGDYTEATTERHVIQTFRAVQPAGGNG